MNSRALLALWTLFLASAALARNPAGGLVKLSESVRSNYTKFEYQIAMRDGVKLFTSVYAPKDHSRQYPILLLRTPYSVAPYGRDNYRATAGPSDSLAREGFIFAYQDVRGRCLSEGEFIDEAPHRARRDVGRFLSGILRGLRVDQLPPGPQSGLAASAHGGRGKRGRLLS